MKTVLFASAAAACLAVASAALAQTTQPQPVPTPPPVQTPSTPPDATATPTLPDAATPPTQGQADAAAAAAVPPAEAAANAEAMASSPAAPVAGDAAVTTPATAPAVCQPRVTSVHFGARGSALSQQNRNAIEYAVDAATVCDLQSVVIADSGEGRVSARRAEAVRTTLIRQGVPRERITVESAANAEGASTGQLDVRMTFVGVALAGAPATTDEAEQPTPTPPAS